MRRRSIHSNLLSPRLQPSVTLTHPSLHSSRPTPLPSLCQPSCPRSDPTSICTPSLFCLARCRLLNATTALGTGNYSQSSAVYVDGAITWRVSRPLLQCTLIMRHSATSLPLEHSPAVKPGGRKTSIITSITLFTALAVSTFSVMLSRAAPITPPVYPIFHLSRYFAHYPSPPSHAPSSALNAPPPKLLRQHRIHQSIHHSHLRRRSQLLLISYLLLPVRRPHPQ